MTDQFTLYGNMFNSEQVTFSSSFSKAEFFSKRMKNKKRKTDANKNLIRLASSQNIMIQL